MAEPTSLQVRYRRYRPSVPVARAKAREVAQDWDLPQIADSLEWVVTELVTNAVIHGRATRGSYVLVTYYLDDDLFRVEVRDSASGMLCLGSAVLADGDVAEGGRGLLLVEALTDSWGITSRVIGKTVWAEWSVASIKEADA